MNADRFMLLLLVIALCGMTQGARADDAPARRTEFVVHEWGMMIAKRAPDGLTLGPPPEHVAQLPAFVVRHPQSRSRPGEEAPLQVWKKPVIYFYGPDGLDVTVTVGTPSAQPLAYFPRPGRLLEQDAVRYHTFRGGAGRVELREVAKETAGIEWSGTLSSRPAHEPPSAPAGHWWTLARNVPAAYVNTDGGCERFLFYEAAARQVPTVSGQVTEETLTLSNGNPSDSGPVVIILHDGHRLWGRLVPNIPGGGGTVDLSRADLMARPWTVEDLTAACERQWREDGMTAEEAKAIVAVWKPQLAGTIGVHVLAPLPAKLYERLFPLTVRPRPDKLVRVGMVFDSVEGPEVTTAWLPAVQERFELWGRDLASDDYAKRREAARRLADAGELAEPYLRRMRTSSDPEVAEAARALLDRLHPEPSTGAAR